MIRDIWNKRMACFGKGKKLNTILILFLFSMITAGCDKLEPIYVECDTTTCLNKSDPNNKLKISNHSDTIYLIKSNLYWYNADEKFGNIPPSSMLVSSSTQSSSKSYISRDIDTSLTKINYSREYKWLFTLTHWLGAIAAVLISVFGLILFSLENKVKKKWILNFIILLMMQVPLVLFCLYVDFPVIFLFLWLVAAISLIPLLIVTGSEESGVSPIITLLVMIFLLLSSGFKSGVRVYIDNATEQSVSIRVNNNYIGELASMHYTKHRVAGKAKVEILLDNKVVEVVNIPTVFWPWKKCIYNVKGKNRYFLKKMRYGKY